MVVIYNKGWQLPQIRMPLELIVGVGFLEDETPCVLFILQDVLHRLGRPLFPALTWAYTVAVEPPADG